MTEEKEIWLLWINCDVMFDNLSIYRTNAVATSHLNGSNCFKDLGQGFSLVLVRNIFQVTLDELISFGFVKDLSKSVVASCSVLKKTRAEML